MQHPDPRLRILIPLDGSDLATASLPYVRALAGSDAELLLLRVSTDPTPLTELGAVATPALDRARERALDTARAYLEDVAEILRDVTSHIVLITEISQAWDAIPRIADREEVDLIIMATHGRGFIGRTLAGSVADRVARSAHVPVMLIHPEPGDLPAGAEDTAELRRIIVPLDGSALARQALPMATWLARQHRLPIHLIRALDLHGEWVSELTEHIEDIGSPLIDALEEELRAEAAALGDEGIEATFAVSGGLAARSIIDATQPGDVIVMTSHGTGGVRRWLLGSVAEKLVHAGVAPVLLVPVQERHAFTRHVAAWDAVETP